MSQNVGGVGGPNKINLDSLKFNPEKGKGGPVNNSYAQITSPGASTDFYHPNRPLQKGINWNQLARQSKNVHVSANQTQANGANLSQTGQNNGVNLVLGQTQGNYADINQDIHSYGELAQVAKTFGQGSDIVLNGDSKSNVFQFADTGSGNITMDASSGLEMVYQDAYTSGGSITMRATAEQGAQMNAVSLDGNVQQSSTWGNNTQYIDAYGSGDTYVQQAAGGNDEQAMNIYGNKNRSAQVGGANYDIATCDIYGKGNTHEMVLGDNDDSGYVTLYPESSNNRVIMRGGDQTGDRASDTFHVTLGGTNNLVAVNPASQPGRNNQDQLYVNTDYSQGNLRLTNSQDPAFAYFLNDKNNNQIGIGHSVTQLFVDNQQVPLR